MQYLEDKVSCINWTLYYSRVHGQIHLAAQFTSWVLWHFQNAPCRAGFLVLKGQKMRPPVTPKLKVREVSQSGFWNISSHPTSEPSFSQIFDLNFWPLEHSLRQWHLSKMERWALTLLACEYELLYCPRNKNGNADGLSRLPILDVPGSTPVPGDIIQFLETINTSPVDATKIKLWTAHDPVLS